MGREICDDLINSGLLYLAFKVEVVMPYLPKFAQSLPNTNSLFILEKYFILTPIHKALAHLFIFVHSSCLNGIQKLMFAFVSFWKISTTSFRELFKDKYQSQGFVSIMQFYMTIKVHIVCSFL